MLRRSRRLVRVALPLVLAAAAGAHVAGCGEGDGDEGGASATEEGGVTTLPEAGVAPRDAAALRTTMRLAHLAADLGPIDFCYRAAKSATFEGPVLGASGGGGADAGDDASDAGDAGGGAVAYREVSRYLTLGASGPLTFALVTRGATSCASPILVADVTLDVGKLATVALLGLGPAPSADAGDGAAGDAGTRALVAFVDDKQTEPRKARVRIINAAFGTTAAPTEGTPLAVRAVGTGTLTVAERVLPRHAGEPSSAIPVDALGYATLDVLPSPAGLAASSAAGTTPDASVDSWVSAFGELHLEGASLHTGFVLTGDGAPLEIVWCSDPSTTGDLTTCERVR
ncbi:MAG: hypothetical protein JWP97_3520 [Labilithrix sp.]|nr:hypothetical protein [Labilithrix sp.]